MLVFLLDCYLESCHRIDCDAFSASIATNGSKILIQLVIQQENKHCITGLIAQRATQLD